MANQQQNQPGQNPKKDQADIKQPSPDRDIQNPDRDKGQMGDKPGVGEQNRPDQTRHPSGGGQQR